jgi:hypothetical protein
MRTRLRNLAFAGVLVGVVVLTTSVPDIFGESSRRQNELTREKVSEETKAKFRKLQGN